MIIAAASTVSFDLTPVIEVFLALMGLLVTAGYIGGRYQKARAGADVRKSDAEARLADGQEVLTHAQYEGFIAEAAQRLETVNQASIARLEAELARNQTHLAELKIELERAKADRNEALAGAHLREQELNREIHALQTRVFDLERLLEAKGSGLRRHSDVEFEAQVEAEGQDR